MKDNGIVKIHGREYKTVALRVTEFREAHPDWTIETEVIPDLTSGDIVVIRAKIMDEKGRLLATGHAEEDRTQGKINQTSALENCETSAIGRALAAMGFAGSEFASADEVANAINQQKKQPASSRRNTPSKPKPDDENPLTFKQKLWMAAGGLTPDASTEILVGHVQSAASTILQANGQMTENQCGALLPFFESAVKRKMTFDEMMDEYEAKQAGRTGMELDAELMEREIEAKESTT